jgi:hypothetical protein
MVGTSGSFDISALLAARGITLAALGVAYLVLLATAAVAAAAFAITRQLLVFSPNRGTCDYGLYAAVALATLLIAVVLENELLPVGAATLHYVLVPQLALLLALHLAIVRQQEPWLVALGATASAANVAVGCAIGIGTELLGPAYWLALLLLSVLLARLWRTSISTQRGFASARSIYVGSKETPGLKLAPQKPWLGLPQWVALGAASAALAAANAIFRGRRLEEIPALEVASESGLLLLATLLVCAIPAGSYWFARRAWMPELTRFVWLAWLVVGFAFTYGNYLGSFTRA